MYTIYILYITATTRCLDMFTRSCAGSCVVTYLMGIGDRWAYVYMYTYVHIYAIYHFILIYTYTYIYSYIPIYTYTYVYKGISRTSW